MKARSRLFVFLAVFFLLVSTPGVGFAKNPSPVTVIVEGAAAIVDGNVSRAFDEAKLDAFRNAIEKGMGVLIHSVTEMKNFEVVRDKVFAKSKGLVTGYRVLRKWKTPDGILHLKVKATVSMKRLNDVLGPVVIDALGNPVVMLLVDERIGKEKPFVSTVESAMLAVFQKAGYQLVDPEQISKNEKRLAALKAMSGDLSLAKELAVKHNADIVVYGRAMAFAYTKQKLYGQVVYGVKGQLQVRAVVSQTAQIVDSLSVSGRQRGMSLEDGAVKVFKWLGYKAGRSMMYKVAYALAGGGPSAIPGRTIRVRVEGVTFSEAMSFKDAVSRIENVVAVYQRSFVGGNAEFDVNIKGSAEFLAIKLEKLGYEVTGFSAGKVVCKPKGK